ncbi:MAG TPA: histidine kinase, partial [Actinomycetes bacterium]|nr:histidine kinase [Actinomycetes bacterium]
HLLGLTVREATTNVLRHSQARRAEVDYRVEDGVARLRVGNDGAYSAPGASGGSGLNMLAERLAAVGGTLTREHQGDRFVVAASLPLDGSAGAEAG